MIPVTVFAPLSVSGAADRYDQPDMDAIVPRINMKSVIDVEHRLRMARQQADAQADAAALDNLLHPKPKAPPVAKKDDSDGQGESDGDSDGQGESDGDSDEDSQDFGDE